MSFPGINPNSGRVKIDFNNLSENEQTNLTNAIRNDTENMDTPNLNEKIKKNLGANTVKVYTGIEATVMKIIGKAQIIHYTDNTEVCVNKKSLLKRVKYEPIVKSDRLNDELNFGKREMEALDQLGKTKLSIFDRIFGNMKKYIKYTTFQGDTVYLNKELVKSKLSEKIKIIVSSAKQMTFNLLII